METVNFSKQIKLVFALLLFGLAVSSANAQVTRGQVLRLFFKASTYHNKGNDEKAIETYREIATLAPRYPDTYLRMAEIYDEAKNYESAIVMYRKYINLEMDDSKVKEPSLRLKALEAELGMEHYEDTEEKQAMQLFAKYNVIESNPKSNTSAKSKDTESISKDANKPKTEEGMSLFAQYKDKGEVETEGGQSTKDEKNKDKESSDTESEIMDFARPMQLTSGQNELSLFNLSALVETRNEVLLENDNEGELDKEARLREDSIAEVHQRVNKYIESSIAEEFNKVQRQNANTLNSIATSGQIDEEEIVLDEAFLANVHKQTSLQTITSASLQKTSTNCDSPIQVYLKRDRLTQYGIKRTTTVLPVVDNTQELGSMLEGRWVSSECNGSGHEIWMFDISNVGGRWMVALDDLSGAYFDDDNLFEVSWNAIKNMWGNERNMSAKLKELRAKTVSVTLSDGIATYTFVTEHQHKPNKTIYTWSRNILEGVTGFIPFGGVVSQVGNTLIDHISEKDLQKTYTTTLQFYLKAITPNAMQCEYVVSEKEQSTEGEKEINRERKSCLLFRASSDYKGFDFVYDGEHNLFNKKMYALVKEEAKSDADKLFPLAYMAYYGAGTKKSISHAVDLMQKLVDKKDCQRAKAWMIPVCYNLSMDVEAYPLRIVRQKFRDVADDLLGDLLAQNYPYAYSLQADIYASNGTNINMIAPSYLKAAELGDVYALYKLGILYMDGQVEERNIEKSISYLTQAAKKGYADAYLQLALLYRQGKVVEKDYNKYIDNLFNAVNDGSIKALKELSDAYSLGLGVEQNFVVANHVKEQYMRASCNEWQEILNIYGYNTMF